MIYKTPLRLTTLHFEQRFLIDDVTFITTSPYIHPTLKSGVSSQSFDYTCYLSVSPAQIYSAVSISGPLSVMAMLCSK